MSSVIAGNFCTVDDSPVGLIPLNPRVAVVVEAAADDLVVRTDIESGAVVESERRIFEGPARHPMDRTKTTIFHVEPVVLDHDVIPDNAEVDGPVARIDRVGNVVSGKNGSTGGITNKLIAWFWRELLPMPDAGGQNKNCTVWVCINRGFYVVWGADGDRGGGGGDGKGKKG